MPMPRVTQGGDSQPTADHIKAHHLSRALVLLPPWFCWVLMLGAGFLLRGQFPGGGPALLTAGLGAILSVYVAVMPHHNRHHVTRWLPSVTMAFITGWLTTAVASGVNHDMIGAWLFGGLTFVLFWDFWLHTRDRDDTDIGKAFGPAAEKAGLEGVRIHSIMLYPHKMASRLRLKPGAHVAGDVGKRGPYLESALKLPPGSVSITPDIDNAASANMVISDPRKLRKPQPWPGPSMPGASIAKPIRTGIWQDGEEVAYTITGHHLQVMGMTGSGKTEGGARAEIAETVTRKDAAVIGFDITKGDQGLGPLEPCLHGLYREKEETLTMLARVHTLVRARTDFLAARGLGKWVEGCGLTHLTAWLEEAPDIIELLNNANAYETWESDVKAGRSAGIRWVISLQRADFSQMPTLIRGQLAKMCFGVAEESDAAFGLSPVQRDRNATPELWQDSQPGMCYLDASCIPDPYKAMAMRTWFWGEDTSRVAEFAAQYPAANRPLDRVTASVLGLQAAGQAQAVGMPAGQDPGIPPAGGRPNLRVVQPADLDDDGVDDDELPAGQPADGGNNNAAGQPASQEEDDDMDPRNSLPPAGTDVDELDTDRPIVAPGGVLGQTRWDASAADANRARLSPEEARAAFDEKLHEMKAAGQDRFQLRDVIGVTDVAGRSRQWLYDVIAECVAASKLRETGGQPTTWMIL